MYENCPGAKVPVTAIDYEFEGLPATPARQEPTKFELTNTAPKEDHELIVFKLNADGEKVDPAKLVAMPQGKAARSSSRARAPCSCTPRRVRPRTRRPS